MSKPPHSFKSGHIYKKVTNQHKKRRITEGDKTIHPQYIEPFSTSIQRSHRRVTELQQDAFKVALEDFLTAIKQEPCMDTKLKKVTRCNCLQKGLQVEEDVINLATTICCFYNMEYPARKLILSQKVSGIMENILGLGQKTLRGPLFSTQLGNTQKIMWLCRHAYQKVFGLGYYKIDSIKNFILNKPLSTAFRKHGL